MNALGKCISSNLVVRPRLVIYYFDTWIHLMKNSVCSKAKSSEGKENDMSVLPCMVDLTKQAQLLSWLDLLASASLGFTIYASPLWHLFCRDNTGLRNLGELYRMCIYIFKDGKSNKITSCELIFKSFP